MKASEISTQSVCGAANLLAVVFREDPDELKSRLGLPHHETEQEREARKKAEIEERERTVYLRCSYCNRLFERSLREYIWQRKWHEKKYVFCNKHCQGKFLAEHFGFIAHPENAFSSVKGKRKWDEAKFKELLNSDLHCKDICMIIGMPMSTFYHYRKRLLSERR